ncbi:nucleotidyl transferase AbiEii/AbiGii toxin family protein [Patescibacteria group bacterium]|nr:nucleotidyl transferase AbiEii/AbiGii toxin family protein [Patescibacteria group bacterium]MBU4016754.1 nucleotidyl transferase AbiEii/AbiGii toxin family protein [Patescibacteria group bacterium]MBU4098711.1 nucleotidyl transferase AbiEii/AbiGii toxin family protein [Patescibacteria group bacterium]
MVLSKDLHRSNFINILRAIYSDPQLRTALGFKGGTAAFLFYDLPRFSVDLDFDLLAPDKKEIVFEKVKTILEKYGVLSEAIEKQYTLFYLLHYQKGERTLKIEISKRSARGHFEVKNYLGISMLVMKKEDMAANKLLALITRKEFASRDMFDLWFFLKNHWHISTEIIKEKANLSLEVVLEKAIKRVGDVSKNQLLRGIGEFIDNKQKAFVKEKLQDELIFYLRLYESEYVKKQE